MQTVGVIRAYACLNAFNPIVSINIKYGEQIGTHN